MRSIVIACLIIASAISQAPDDTAAVQAAPEVPATAAPIEVEVIDNDAVSATNAKEAADSAKAAANVANKVAEHSIHLAKHAQDALHHAREALQHARVDSQGLSEDQRMALKKAENKLQQATQTAEYGELKQGRYLNGQASAEVEGKLGKAQDKLDSNQSTLSELQTMLDKLQELRTKLQNRGADVDDAAAIEQQISELEQMIKQMQAEGGTSSGKSHDELKAEIGRLEDEINQLTATPAPEYGELHYEIPNKPPVLPIRQVEAASSDEDEGAEQPGAEQPAEPVVVERSSRKPKAAVEPAVAAGPSAALDTDMEMPYGDLEPFGREDTAQELTEASIRESDGMVDQLEKAEVAEEKRAVFRALTRLRGAAITSFDGIARSQTGNIDEYNKVNKWRNDHPLHHLADEESDVSKWAFPDNADF